LGGRIEVNRTALATASSAEQEAKVAFLRRPDAWPDRPREVETLETHLSWVFLTDRHAWKMKKPMRWDSVDLRGLEDRRRDCEREVRLNRRLAPDVYLGVLPLTADAGGDLHVGGPGEPVDWLVEMRRLPRRRMLDEAIRRGEASVADVRRVVTRLVAFYQDEAPRADWTPEGYRRHLARSLRETCDELSTPRYGLPLARAQAITERALDLLAREPELFAARIEAGRVVEAHGDLRPEHVCLLDEPVIIDCLQFDRELRTLDAVSELTYLALECERLGAPRLAEAIHAVYVELTGDRQPARLLAFHRARHGLMRAMVTVRHLDDPEVDDAARWRRKALEYLELGGARP
jgi:aminoglycoside phosphotransferase family enzyme